MLDEGQVAEGVTVLVLAEMQHLAPKKKTHQHPSAVTATALERTTEQMQT